MARIRREGCVPTAKTSVGLSESKPLLLVPPDFFRQPTEQAAAKLRKRGSRRSSVPIPQEPRNGEIFALVHKVSYEHEENYYAAPGRGFNGCVILEFTSKRPPVPEPPAILNTDPEKLTRHTEKPPLAPGKKSEFTLKGVSGKLSSTSVIPEEQKSSRSDRSDGSSNTSSLINNNEQVSNMSTSINNNCQPKPKRLSLMVPATNSNASSSLLSESKRKASVISVGYTNQTLDRSKGSQAGDSSSLLDRDSGERKSQDLSATRTIPLLEERKSTHRLDLSREEAKGSAGSISAKYKASIRKNVLKPGTKRPPLDRPGDKSAPVSSNRRPSSLAPNSDESGRGLGKLGTLGETQIADVSMRSSFLDTSTIIESGMAITRTDADGHKYINQYMLLDKLGRGSYGVVKLCFDTKLYKKVAMKIMNKARLKKLCLGKDKTAYKLVENEIAIMKKMCHPNIVQLYEIIDDPQSNKLYLVMQCIGGGTLMKKIKEGGKIPIDKCWKYFRELMAGLEYCHNVAGIIHRDIKPENLLLDESDTLYIADFGVSFVIENGSDESRATLGSAYFMAPEICKCTNYKGRQTDIWAAGVTLYFTTVGKLPFEAKGQKALAQAIINNPLVFPGEGIDDELKALIEGMLEKDPAKRFTMDVIHKHPWVTKGGKFPMAENEGKISVTEDERKVALCDFEYSYAMARVKSVFKKSLRRARARILARKKALAQI